MKDMEKIGEQKEKGHKMKQNEQNNFEYDI